MPRQLSRRFATKQYHLVATALTETAVDPYAADLAHDRIALLIGNEHAGLSATLLDAADTVACIPMRGFIQSFNASVTAALMLAEITRQRRTSGQVFYLDNASAHALASRWLGREDSATE
ncbi:MAG: TrmH family RNA methyltransferase [Patescibacteria group bacterium]|jgi:tRNA (guanosine-2'-O-)-methyltransferase